MTSLSRNILLAAGVLALALLLTPCVFAASGQTQNDIDVPLRGQGFPENATTEIYVSVYLDRMIDVDDIKYQHHEILSFYISWYDPTAYAKVINYTSQSIDPESSYQCQRTCSNMMESSLCCDGIYLPTFIFRNAVDFPTDRPYSIGLFDNGTVLWNAYVDTVNTQTMSFKHFPFDSFDLLTLVQFSQSIHMDKPHPGIKVLISSSGPRLYNVGEGDALSEWNVQGLNVSSRTVVLGNYLAEWSTTPSVVGDPIPLAGPNGTDAQIADMVTQWIIVTIRVSRFASYHIISSILPVTVVAFLSLAVFWVPTTDLYGRMELLVVLVLALTAVQFVLDSQTPSSSYVLPTQQFILATYILLALVSVEAIVAYNFATYKTREDRKEAMLAARLRVQTKSKKARALHRQELDFEDDPDAAFATAAGRQTKKNGNVGDQQTTEKKKPDWVVALRDDEYYGEDLARRVDIISFSVLGVLYLITVVLIFVLQDGYIDTFQLF